jgi:hypothetical protein
VPDDLSFEWDDNNLRHVLVVRPHGLTPALVEQFKEDKPKFFADLRPGRAGTHLLIASDEAGRFWTVIVVQAGETSWRPITGWPSTVAQIRRYREED